MIWNNMTSDRRPIPADEPALIGFQKHDHQNCVETALATAEGRCKEEGLRLTPVRRKVLEMLVQEHRALGAYAILDRLREEGFGSQPPVAYRALDFLVENGFVHKIERLNAFVACAPSGVSPFPAFMICRSVTRWPRHSLPLPKAHLAPQHARLVLKLSERL